MLPKVEHLPETHQRAWLYIGLFPNCVMTFYPESIGFYQEIPLTSGESLLRCRRASRLAGPLDSSLDQSNRPTTGRRIRAG
jgi:hypothetical protein